MTEKNRRAFSLSLGFFPLVRRVKRFAQNVIMKAAELTGFVFQSYSDAVFPPLLFGVAGDIFSLFSDMSLYVNGVHFGSNIE